MRWTTAWNEMEDDAELLRPRIFPQVNLENGAQLLENDQNMGRRASNSSRLGLSGIRNFQNCIQDRCTQSVQDAGVPTHRNEYIWRSVG